MAENGFVKSEEELNKAVTLGVLLEYTDGFLIPRFTEAMNEMEQRMSEKMGKLEYNLKVYVDQKLDEKLSEHTLLLFKKLDSRFERERQFKGKVVEMFKKNNFGTPEDIAFLEGLAS